MVRVAILLLVWCWTCLAREYYNFSDACIPRRGSDGNDVPFEKCSNRDSVYESDMFKLMNFTLLDTFASIIKGRTFVFIGDSTMGMQHYAFCNSLGAVEIDSFPPTRVGPTHDIPNTPDDVNINESFDEENVTGSREESVSIDKSCFVNELNTSAVFLGYGRLFQWGRTLTDDHMRLIAQTVSSLNQTTDAVLFGVGVHWHYFCGNELSRASLNSMNNFEYALLRLLSLITLPQISPGASGLSRISNSIVTPGPILLYRESLPQHFSSSNGQYPAPIRRGINHQKIGSRSKKSKCVDLNEASVSGQGKYHSKVGQYNNAKSIKPSNKSKAGVVKSKTSRFNPATYTSPHHVDCNPNCLPATWQNDLASDIIRTEYKRIGVLRVFKELECVANEHSMKNKEDCTHYSPRVNFFLNYLFLQYIEQIS